MTSAQERESLAAAAKAFFIIKSPTTTMSTSTTDGDGDVEMFTTPDASSRHGDTLLASRSRTQRSTRHEVRQRT
jgi:hypothetical protein